MQIPVQQACNSYQASKQYAMQFPGTAYATISTQPSTTGQLTTAQIIGLPQQQLVTNAGISYIPSQTIAAAQQQQQIIANNSNSFANASSSISLSPQVLQQLQQHLCSQNVITQPTTQYIIASQGSNAGTAVTAIPQGYQTVQTVGGQQVLVQTNVTPNVVNQQIPNSVTTSSIAPNNQLIQLVLSNGQVMTTTLANLQAMGATGSPNLSAATSQQYSTTQYQTNGNFYVNGTQSGAMPLTTQLVTNSAGQVFAITPQITSQFANQTPQQTIVGQNPSTAATTQYIQIAAPAVQQMIGQQPQMVTNAAVVQQQQQQLEESTKLLLQQQLAQQQQQQLLLQQKQQQSQSQSWTISTNSKPTNVAFEQNSKSSESTQTRIANSPASNTNLPNNTQTLVSSTTSKHQPLTSSQENTSHSFENSEIKADRISVQSQTSSPSSSNSTMEAESTTHCNLPNKGLAHLNSFNVYIKTILILINRYHKQY